jgi:tRNA pseudouridine55 synthase
MTTDTDDLEGETLRVSPARELSLETVRGYLPRFVGSIAQVPPVYSAIHRDGKRLYELARRGEAVEVSPRNVEIYGITVSGWSSGEFPELELTIECGTGTYIRSIARDLGNLVGTGGTLAGLVRVESCGLELDGSLDPETLDPDGIHEVLLSPRVALKQLEFRRLSPAEALDWSHGRPIPLASGRTGECMGAESDENKFLGIGRVAGDPGVCFLQPKVVLT